MLIVFRVDSGATVGSGHVMRCLVLAAELDRRGHKVLFLCRDLRNNIIDLIEMNRFEVRILSPSTSVSNDDDESDFVSVREVLNTLKPSWIVVDHYQLGERWERRVKEEYQSKILVLDDVPCRRHYCDVLLDQNYHAIGTDPYKFLIPTTTVRLYGTGYALIKVENNIVEQDTKNERRGNVQRVLVYFGSVDSLGNTLKVLTALSSIQKSVDLSVDVIIGRMNESGDDIISYCKALTNFTCHNTLPSLSGLMQNSDLMLSAGGSVIWERCRYGLPGIVVHCSENQRNSSELMHRDGVHVHLGHSLDVTASKWEIAIRNSMADVETNRLMSVRSLAVCDGNGANRVATQVLRLS